MNLLSDKHPATLLLTSLGRRGWAWALASLLALLPLRAGWAQEDPGRMIITFDALTRKFTTQSMEKGGTLGAAASRSTSVSTGRAVVIRITNPNSFRETYSIEAYAIDFHAVNIADAFKALPGFTVALPPPRAGDVPTANLRPAEKMMLSPDLQRAYDAFITSRDAVINSLKNVRVNPKWQTVDDDFLNAIIAGKTNASTRKAVAKLTKTYFGQAYRVPRTQDLSDSEARRFIILSTQLENPVRTELAKFVDIEAKVDILKRAKANWKIVYDAAKAMLMSPEKELALRADEEIRTDTTEARVAAVKESLNKIINEDIARAKNLLALVMDKVTAPTYLEKKVEAEGDRLDIKITVTSNPATSLLALGKTSGGGPLPAADPGPPLKPAGGGGAGDEVSPPRQLVDRPADFTVEVFTYKMPVYNRWVLDASAGLVGTSLHRERYVVRNEVVESGATQPVVRLASRDQIEVKPAIMLHYYRTRSNGLAFGPTLGLGMSGSTVDRYLVGVTMVRGQERRLFLTLGAAFGEVERLKGYRVGGLGPEGGTGLTEKVNRTGFFAAVTLQFGRL